MSPANDLVIDRTVGQPRGESVRWDGKPGTMERLRELMPGCVTFFSGTLEVKVLRKISPRRSVHDVALVPVGWDVTPRTCKHGEMYAVIKPPGGVA